MYTIYINNTLPPALAVHEIYRDIFGPPMVLVADLPTFKLHKRKDLFSNTSCIFSGIKNQFISVKIVKSVLKSVRK